MKPNNIQRRKFVGFLVFAIAWAAGILLWLRARSQPLLGGAPTPFRKVLEWNGKLWHSLFNPARINDAEPPAPGKLPRFNGELGLKSPLHPAEWKLEVLSEIEAEHPRKLHLSLQELKAMPRTATSAQFVCIEGWSDIISYAGIRFSDFLKLHHIGTHSSGAPFRYVALETPDEEYYVSLDMESMLHPQAILAYELNGRPLEPPNGAPLRLIIPVKYGIKSLKRVGRIYFSDTRPPDYWAERGYDWFAGL